MPITRSKKGAPTTPLTSEGTTSATEYTATTAPDTSATSASGASTLQETTRTAAEEEQPAPQQPMQLPTPPPVIKRHIEEQKQQKKAKSRASTSASRKAAKLRKAKEDLLKLQVELAAAKIASIEAESDTDSDEDLDTVMEDSEPNLRRVDNWLNNSHTHQLAIETEARNPPALPAPPVLQQIENKPQEEATQAPAGGQQIAAAASNKIDLTELAAAISQAARSGQASTSRVFNDLPFFGGHHQEWLSFKAAYFESQSGFTDIENLARLRRSLKGKAKEAVESLLIFCSNPRDVMKTLEARFGRPDAIAIAELERIRSLPRLNDAPRELCIFASKMSNIVATLGAINKQQYLYNPEVAKTTIEKLTPTLRYRWYDYAAQQPSDEADIVKLARFLNREAEICGPYAQPEGINEAPSIEKKRSQRTFNTQETHKKTTYGCPICQEDGHGATGCEQFKKANSARRWDIAKESRLCFRCLKYRNRMHSCKGKKCEIDGCNSWHHQMLHYKKEENKEVVSSTWTSKKTAQAFLKIIPVEIVGPKKKIKTYALLDDGSTVTLIDEEIAQRAGLRGRKEPLHIEAIAETRLDTAESRRLNFSVRGAGRTHRIQARSIKQLKLSPQTVKNEDIEHCGHLYDIAEELKYQEARPRLLIGQDNWHLLIAEENRIGRRNQPIASLTPLGWVLHGACSRTIGHKVNVVRNIEEEAENLDVLLKNFFSLEALNIAPKMPRSDPEVQALKTLEEKTTRLEDGRFQTSLLWKKEDIKMPNNRQYAIKRMEATERRINREPDLKSKVIEQMDALLKKGYAEPAPEEKNENRTWYLPCFPVINPMKPGKIRMVHDAAATTKGVSLNDALLTGPDLLQSLPGVLMRMRQHPIAVSADIAEMFLQIRIHPEDRDALRYLWRDGDISRSPKEYRMTSLIFGATSSPATAIYVKNRNAEDFKTQCPEAVVAIERNHYMDDYIQSFDNEESAVKIAKQVARIHQHAHFELKKWTSNSMKVLKELDSEAQDEGIDKEVGPKTEKVLGMVWQTSIDALKYNLDLSRLPEDILQKKPTKRQALRIVMSLFDPLGLVSVITIKAKQILQEIWRRSTGWDDQLDEDLTEEWAKWTQHVLKLKNISIPRSYAGYSEGGELQLHVFVDASEVAYAAALYWRLKTPDGRVCVSLVLAKARVAPLKTTSIPRLELQAAVMGSRMANSVIEEHDRKPDSRVFWTDSRTVLTWLKTGSRTYKPFVAHRIAELEENTKTEEWRWVPTKLNVADDATRDVPKDLSQEHRWFTGPSFLKEDPESWPRETIVEKLNTGEERTHQIASKKSSISSATPDVTRFSKWEKLVRTTARILQFIELCRKKTCKTAYARTRANRSEDPLWGKKQVKNKIVKNIIKKEDNYRRIPAELLIQAEDLLIKASQEDSFEEEIEDLSKNRRVKNHSKLKKIAIEIVNGVIAVKTRIGAATDIPEVVKRPIILDGRHPIARLYIEYVHRVGHHQGVEATINQCRQRFHILGLRTTARGIVHRCIPCGKRKWTAPEPPTGNHPASRLAHHQRAFTFTGIDYFGPLQTTFGRGTRKTYVALFTCLTTRAVHLEMANTLSTDSTIMALRRFIARRGCPKEIWSDNGTNLHGAEKKLRQAADAAVEEAAANRKISWRFIPPGAPFMGGAWERLVKTVKIALAAVLDNRPTPEEILVTVLAEVEMTVNSRPLTHVSVDPEDPETLTPNHFLLLGPAFEPPMGDFTSRDLLGKKNWRTSQQLANMFWSRWVKEYLPELQNRREPHGKGPLPQIGDIVMVVDNTLPRNTWPLGRVIATYPGQDGIVRTVDVKTKGGVLRRPTKKIVILQAEQRGHRSTPE